MSRPQLLATPTVRPPDDGATAVAGTDVAGTDIAGTTEAATTGVGTDVAGTTAARTAKTCRFAGNCSCVFNRVEQPAAVPDAQTSVEGGLPRAAAEAELAVLMQRGWKVVSADSRSIVLQRQRNMPFCVDVLLCAVTVMLWSIHMVWRARHPKIETTTLTLAP